MSALVSGAAGGIGGELVGMLLSRGEAVTATDADGEALAGRARDAGWPGERLLLRTLDVRDADAWERCVADATGAHGPLSLGLNVAGCIVGGEAVEQGAADVARQLDVNARGTILGTQAMARAMLLQGRGHIVNFASMAALMPSPGFAVYTASKYAVRGFSLSVAEELRTRGVAVTVVSTGAVDTKMLEGQRERWEASGGSGFGLLSPRTVAEVVLSERVLARRPREVFVPRAKGLLARAFDLWPGPALGLAARLRRGQ